MNAPSNTHTATISWENKAWALVACAEHATSTTMRIKWMIRNSILISAYRETLEADVAPKNWTETVKAKYIGIIESRYNDLFGSDRSMPTYTATDVAALPYTDRAIPALLTVLATVQQNGQTHYDTVASLMPSLRIKENAVLEALYNDTERAAAIADARAVAAEVNKLKAQGYLSHSQLKQLARRDPNLHAAAKQVQGERQIQFAEAVRVVYTSGARHG